MSSMHVCVLTGELEIRGRIETIKTTALLTSVGYLGEFCRSEETYCHSDFREKSSVKVSVKNSQGIK